MKINYYLTYLDLFERFNLLNTCQNSKPFIYQLTKLLAQEMYVCKGFVLEIKGIIIILKFYKKALVI